MYRIQGHHTLVETLQGGVSSGALGTIMMARKMLNQDIYGQLLHFPNDSPGVSWFSITMNIVRRVKGSESCTVQYHLINIKKQRTDCMYSSLLHFSKASIGQGGKRNRKWITIDKFTCELADRQNGGK
jgi:hypothetical protein